MSEIDGLKNTHGAPAQTVSSVPVTPACRIVVEGDSKQLLGVGEKCAAQVAIPRILRPLNSAAAAVRRSRPSAQTVAPRTHRNSSRHDRWVLERKLTAILCADVFGYSRLMGENEEATLHTLSSYRKLIDSLIEQHHGRFVNSAGDSVLAEFASVVNAAQCVVEIQTALKAENANLPPERRMEFRIGVNLGDVVVDGEQIFGDGINVAARLESLAQPGGINISGSVHEQIGSRLLLSYQDLGEQQVKNIAKPVRVFRVLPEVGSTTRKTRRVQRKYFRRDA